MFRRPVIAVAFFVLITVSPETVLANQNPETVPEESPVALRKLAQAAPLPKPGSAQPGDKVPPPGTDAPVPDVGPGEAVLPPGDTSPLIRLETGGPRSYVSSLAFSPDGSSLYAAGWDKAVQIWNRNANGRYEYSQAATLRVPSGSGLYGGLNAMVVSADGQWLAAAGQGHTREMSGERNTGWVLPAGVLSRTAQFDEGLIYVFNTATRATRLLRGHRGPVQSIAFVAGSRSNPPELVSVAEERVEGGNDLHPRIRFWDVSQTKELASLNVALGTDGKSWTPLPDLQGWRPGLTAWSTGANPRQARVALAWGDDQFRIWDTQTGQITNVKSSPNTLAVVPIPGGRLMTGAHADIGVWPIPVSPTEKLGVLSRQQYQPANFPTVRAQNLASTAAVVPNRNGGPPYVMFVVTRYTPDGRSEYRLLITTSTTPLKVVREFDLPWRGDVRTPALAVTHDGKKVAVSGTDSNEISVYSVDDLIAGRTPSPQVLGSRGLNIREAAFVRDGDRWGLIFSDTINKIAGKFPDTAAVLDIQKRRMEPATDRWRLAVASLDGWSAEITKPGSLQIRRAKQPPLNLQLDEQHVVTSYAFCPPSAHCQVPLIAVATHLRGQPLLQMFRGDTGEPLRWCVGHTERIRNLAFSDDGKMLLSLAADRTASIWTTTDLAEKTLDQHGRIADLTVYPQDNKLIVTEAPSGLPLKRGDEVISVEQKGEVTNIRSTKDFYKEILQRRPKESLTVNIRRSGKLETVTCPIGQAVDESKPLFTLFVVPGDHKGEWDWIGWHPLGNFDASRQEIESLLGWQFNTGEADCPAKFAAIGEYRDGFYRRDLIQSLIESQKLILPEAEEAPDVSLWLRSLDGTPINKDYEDLHQINVPQVSLVAEVTGVAKRRIGNLSVAFNGNPPQILKHTSGQEWTTELSTKAWPRGVHRLTVRLQTPEREVIKVEQVEFHPAPPKIEWLPQWKTEIQDTTVAVRATAIPTNEPIQVQLRVLRPGQKDAVTIRTWDARERLEINEAVSIEPGENRLELVAFNASVPELDRALETTSVAVIARRSTAVMAPRITLNSISTISDQGEESAIEAEGDVYTSASSKIRVRGQISSEAPMDRVSLQLGEVKQALAGFKSGETRKLAIDATVVLKPGVQWIELDAAVRDEKDGKKIRVKYEPPVPLIASLTMKSVAVRELLPSMKSDSHILFAEYHEPSIVVTATINGHLEHAYRATVLVNDERLADELVQIDRSGTGEHKLVAKVALVGGKNRIAVRVENEWSRQPNHQALDVELRRPPEIVKVVDEKEFELKPQSFAFRVRSSLPVRSAKVVVDNADERRTFTASPVNGVPDEWLLQANQFGLPEGEHTLKITATNDEGVTLEPVVHKVHIEKAPSPPPVLTIVSPVSTDTSTDHSLTVNNSKIQIRYLVNSIAPTKLRLRLRGNSAKFELFENTIESDAVPIDGSTGVEEIELFEGVNEFELTAENAGGSSQRQIISIAYVPPTATVEILSVGNERPRLRNDGTAYFDQASPKARVTVRGRVRVPVSPAEGQLSARIWVNSFLLPTVPVVTEGAQSTHGQFETDVVFNRSKENSIKVEVFRLDGRMASELGSTNTLVIDCAIPELEQELYVLLLGNGDLEKMRINARKSLMETALLARQLTRQQGSQEVWASDAFARIHVHDALNAAPAVVQNRLRELVGKMLRNLKGGMKSGHQSIVMIYFQGQVTLMKDDFAFGTFDPETPVTRAITGRILEENLARAYGAHLIYLDLQQGSMNLQESDVWPKAPHLGIAVKNWKGDEPQPKEVGSAFQEFFPQSKNVRELALKLDQRYREAEQKYVGQLETREDLTNLNDVRIGALEKRQ